ncbi:MAG: DUF2961 domain-containing protein [Kiritimatiellae bacterium]|nr:DUF2961 domain-containing protein [Kiritimatiellia bacterium]
MDKWKIMMSVLIGMLLAGCETPSYNGLGTGMASLCRLSDAKTRSISPENFTGERNGGALADPVTDKGKRNVANASHAAQELGKGWKVNPFVVINPGETLTLADIKGPGAIQQIWMTPTGNWRLSIIRMYWDDEVEPSVKCPVGDFFASAYNRYAQLSSLAVCVNPGSAFNCYWQMPFRRRARITMENCDVKAMRLYYQVNYALTEVPADAAYFHAQFRRSNPTKGSVHTLVDGISGKGQYVGTYLAWRVHDTGWWGEGEIKFYLDGEENPTICGTGTEDYFCGSYNFEIGGRAKYREFTTPYTGLHQVIKPDDPAGVTSFGLYRWHITDPIRFDKSLRVTIQDLGWKKDGIYNAQQSDIASTVFWYQTEPHATFSELPGKETLLSR